MVTSWSVRLEKHQTIKILLMVDFLRIFKMLHFSKFFVCTFFSYVFVCHQYTELRQDLLNPVSDICQSNLNVLLCGDITLTIVQNKHIFKAVQEF